MKEKRIEEKSKKWFSTKEIAKEVNIGRSSCTSNLVKLRKTTGVPIEWKIIRPEGESYKVRKYRYCKNE